MGSEGGRKESAETVQSSRRSSDLQKIRILSVLLAFTLIAFALYVAVTSNVFDYGPPYPSETTPLTIQSWGVTWDWGDAEGVIDLSVNRFEYSNMSYKFEINGDGGGTSMSGPFVLGEYMDIDDFVVPATQEEAEGLFHLSTATFEGDESMTVMDCCYVSDDTNPLEFNRGDRISIVHLVYVDGLISTAGFEEGTTYEITFTAFDDGGYAEEGYGFAVSDGVLYSWVDHGAVDDPRS